MKISEEKSLSPLCGCNRELEKERDHLVYRECFYGKSIKIVDFLSYVYEDPLYE